MDWTLADLHFEMADMVDEETESKRSFDCDDSVPLHTKSEGLFESEPLGKPYAPASTYEGRHRYDPHFKWKKEAERKVVRKIDKRIGLFIALMFFALALDRGNITQTPSAKRLADWGLSFDEYQNGQRIYFASLLLAALPSQLMAKRLGAATWMSLQMISWGILTSMQSGISGPWSFWVTRSLIGVFEGGFLPSAILYLSYFYTSSELPKRLSLFWISYPAVYVVCTLSTVAVVRSSGLWEIPGWRWLYCAEGAMTLAIGCVSWLYLPPSPTQTLSNVHGEKAWFSIIEEKIMVNRILRDDHSKGDMHHLEPLTPRDLIKGVFDYHLWPIYLLGLTWHLPIFPVSQYLTTNLQHLPLETWHIQLLHLPSPAIWMFNVLAFTFVSEWLDERLLLSTLSQIWVLPVLIANYCLPTDRDLWHTWVFTMLACGQPYVHAILIGMASRNAGSVRKRTMSLVLYSMSVQASDVIGSNMFRIEDAPFYFRGLKQLSIVVVCNIFLFLAAKRFYVFFNRRRQAKWGEMSKYDRQVYLATTKDRGNKKLDFIFAH